MITIGLDVGKEQDPAALAVLHTHGELRPHSHRPRWAALSIGNIELGTKYAELARTVVDLGREFSTAGYSVVVVIDATGIGAAVLELARTAAPELHIVAVTISGGRVLSHAGPDDYVVGKHRLTETLQVALQQQGLAVPDTDGTHAFREQLSRFVTKRTRTGYQQHEAATGHDDLVLATELALWAGDTMFDQHAGVIT
jgi:hypothetical protein